MGTVVSRSIETKKKVYFSFSRANIWHDYGNYYWKQLNYFWMFCFIYIYLLNLLWHCIVLNPGFIFPLIYQYWHFLAACKSCITIKPDVCLNYTFMFSLTWCVSRKFHLTHKSCSVEQANWNLKPISTSLFAFFLLWACYGAFNHHHFQKLITFVAYSSCEEAGLISVVTGFTSYCSA